MKIGYIRVSTEDQNPARQETLMKELGVEAVYIETASGKNTDRPELKAMLAFVREGDTVMVESISRFARNTQDLLELIERLTGKGVAFVSKKEAIDTATPSGKFMLTIFGAVAELEREYLLQREGIAEAKMAGKYKGRTPISVDGAKFKAVYDRWKNKEITAVEAQKRLGLSSNTFYSRVKRYELEGRI